MKKVQSLSKKIVLSIALISILTILVMINIFEKINKEAFYTVEMEKADLIVNTLEPLIALNIYLDMNDKTDKTIFQFVQNPNILAIKVLKNNVVINEIESKEYKSDVDKSFIVKKTIFQPNSEKEVGTLILVYSTKNYDKLINKYNKTLVESFFVFSIFFLLFSLYVKKLLSPLRKIAESLKNYSPNQKIDIPLIAQNNEIGLISNSLIDMQKNILEYSQKQEDINNYLEDKVNEKTLELRQQLYTNSLTGIPNRLSLLNSLKNSNEVALLIINIDDFKEINDFFGHLAGDYILISLSHVLNKTFEKQAGVTFIHLSGDEFAILFIKKPSIDEFMHIAQKLVYDVDKMIFSYESNEISIRITIGGVFQRKKALEKADIALKLAKQQKKSFLLYDEKLNIEKQYKNNIEWVKKLKNAIDNDRIIPYFQPIFDNLSNKIVSVECLVRLIDDSNNINSPYQFLTIAKKSKLYKNITKTMIQKSCQYFEHINCDFSVNLSVDDIMDEKIIDYLKENIEKYNVSKKIVFEILETEGIENYQEVLSFIREMKAIGCRIAIDDFGSGYSNFEYLLQLNIDYIKIDGSLIKNIDTDKNAQIIVETIVDFAKKLKVQTVAEFVHNEAVYLKVKELGVDRTQGYYFAEPQVKFSL